MAPPQSTLPKLHLQPKKSRYVLFAIPIPVPTTVKIVGTCVRRCSFCCQRVKVPLNRAGPMRIVQPANVVNFSHFPFFECLACDYCFDYAPCTDLFPFNVPNLKFDYAYFILLCLNCFSLVVLAHLESSHTIPFDALDLKLVYKWPDLMLFY
ncbi:hypothetical protein COLO4_20588 [Corchorus olitorius]|uniref:Uncharacterized protein n=1 Tax=Corchorus olitorius TaxID=93759 RepID=A0A1R3IYU9_9ROSI|nr:hypothetical protein COLO4_20588 [Corchorus olitorius]